MARGDACGRGPSVYPGAKGPVLARTGNRIALDQTSKLISLRDIAGRIDSGGDLEAKLKHLIASACRHADWAMGSIMAIDVQAGYGQVLVRHDPTLIAAQLPEKWKLGSSPALVALKRNEPVHIRDAHLAAEFPGYQQDARQRDYHTVLVMPMACKDAAGRPMVLSVIARQVKDVSDDELAFLATIVHLGSIAVEREHRLQEQVRANERLRQALGGQAQLMEHVLGDEPVSALSEMVETLLHSPIIVVDFSDNQIVVGRSPDRAILGDAEWQAVVPARHHRQILRAAQQGRTTAARLELVDVERGFAFAARIEPLFVDHQIAGAVIVFHAGADPEDPGVPDPFLLDAARFALSVQIMRNRNRFRSESHAMTELFRELVEKRWRDEAELYQRALHLGLALRVPQQMLVLDISDQMTAQGGAVADFKRVLARVASSDAASALVVALDERIACLLPADTEFRRGRMRGLADTLAAELGRGLEKTPVLVMAGPCKGTADYPAVWQRCGRLIGIARTFGLTGVLAADGSGPLEMLVSALGSSALRDYVGKTVGPVARYDLTHGSDYLETLAAYLRAGCRSQACADAMGVHVSTLRYRLARLNELFGIEIDTPEKRFELELAIRLQMITRSE